MHTPLLCLHVLSLSNSYIALSVAFSHIFTILLMFFKQVFIFQGKLKTLEEHIEFFLKSKSLYPTVYAVFFSL
jgi:hypothetical protein